MQAIYWLVLLIIYIFIHLFIKYLLNIYAGYYLQKQR